MTSGCKRQDDGGGAIWWRGDHLVLTSSHFLCSWRLVVPACTARLPGGERKRAREQLPYPVTCSPVRWAHACHVLHPPTWRNCSRPTSFLSSDRIARLHLYPLFDVLDHTNHTFSENSWHPLSTVPLPTHPSPAPDPLNPPRTHPKWPFLHIMMFYTIQTKYILKPHGTHYPLSHWPFTHHLHRPTKPDYFFTLWRSSLFISVLKAHLFFYPLTQWSVVIDYWGVPKNICFQKK